MTEYKLILKDKKPKPLNDLTPPTMPAINKPIMNSPNVPKPVMPQRPIPNKELPTDNNWSTQAILGCVCLILSLASFVSMFVVGFHILLVLLGLLPAFIAVKICFAVVHETIKLNKQNKKQNEINREQYKLEYSKYEELLLTYDKEIEQYEIEYEKAKLEFESAMDSYKSQCSEAKLKYESELASYNEALIDQDRDYQIRVEQFTIQRDSKVHLVEAVFSQEEKIINSTITKTKNTLKKMLEIGWIHPKYQDFPIIGTIHEYFETGRVSELEGPNGAYNLYESELMQKVIISQLSVISTDLEQIKNNQYKLYQELKNIKNEISSIGVDVRHLVKSVGKIEKDTETIVTNLTTIAEDVQNITSLTQDIAKSSKISAKCAKIIANNTEAIKWLSLVS